MPSVRAYLGYLVRKEEGQRGEEKWRGEEEEKEEEKMKSAGAMPRCLFKFSEATIGSSHPEVWLVQ